MNTQVKKLLIKILLFLPILLLIVGFNYFVDPASIFKSKVYYTKIATILLKGNNVANLSNYDERLLQKELINNLTKRKNIIVLGSSRVMQIKSCIFNSNSFLNNGVSGASIEDDMAIYGMYREKGMIPSKVIIGLDPWLLNKNNGQSRYKSLNYEYQKINEYIQHSTAQHSTAQHSTAQHSTAQHSKYTIVNDKYFELFSPSYFQSSFQYWINGFFENKNRKYEFYETNKNEINESLKLSDGSIRYDYKTRNTLPSNVYKTAITYSNSYPIYSLGDFSALDKELINTFEDFISLLKKDGVEIIFILPPYHPVVYSALIHSDDYKIIIDVEKYFTQYAYKNKIKIIGSYNPDVYNFTNIDFIDGMHQTSNSIDRLTFLLSN